MFRTRGPLRCLGSAASAAGSTLIVRSLDPDEQAITIALPPVPEGSNSHLSDVNHDGASHSATKDVRHAGVTERGYRSVVRSQFSLLRGRTTPPGQCACGFLCVRSGARSPNELGDPSQLCAEANCCGLKMGTANCCCAALLFPLDASLSAAAHAEGSSIPMDGSTGAHGMGTEQDKSWRDSFVFALKICGAEELVVQVLGAEVYNRLVGRALATDAVVVGLCEDLKQLRTTLPALNWAARTLLSSDECNYVMWLRRESADMAACYSRAPSLRALYILWRIASSMSTSLPVRKPTMADVEEVQKRMLQNKVPLTLCDVAVLVFLGLLDEHLPESIVQQLLAMVVAQRDSCSSVGCGALEAVLATALLCHWASIERQRHMQHLAATCTAAPDTPPATHPPVRLFHTADRLRSMQMDIIWSPGRADAEEPTAGPAIPSSDLHALVLDSLCKAFLGDVQSIAHHCEVPVGSPCLCEVTTWMLKEIPHSTSCHRHLRRLIECSASEALTALEKSGLLRSHAGALEAVVNHLVPVLELCGNEEFYSMVIRSVLDSLENRLRRDPTSFAAHDMTLLASLGTRLCGTSATESNHAAFDKSVRGQMEELQVMDGSPWALCVSTYRSIREILQGLVREHRSFKEQVHNQMRQLGLNNPFDRSSEGTAHCAPPSAGDSAKDRANGEKVPSTAGASAENVSAPGRLVVPQALRQRFLVFIENLVKAQVDEGSRATEKSILISSELFAFVNKHVPVPNIQDEYRRKIFLLVNVAEDPETARRRHEVADRLRRQQQQHTASTTHPERRGVWGAHRATRAMEEAKRGAGEAALSLEDDPDELDSLSGGADEIPAELRFLVSSLSLALSPWASVMILREVLAESAGNNPRYTYVLNAAIDLQLPISTTRSRIATTLNTWRFLNSQSHKLTAKENLMMKQRCVWNLPLSYILSSYWSLLTSTVVAFIIFLNVVGLDYESQLVANTLFQKFTPWEECMVEGEGWAAEAAADIASDYLGQDEIAQRHREDRSSADIILSSASYLFLGYDDQRRPMTLISVGSDDSLSEQDRVVEEFACASAVVKEISLHVPFPFYVDMERSLPTGHVETRVAERIRRVAFNNTWFLPRMIIRTFPLGRRFTEHSLVSHTCRQANLTRRRITFLLYMHDGVPVTPQLLSGLRESVLSQNANLVVVVHERSLRKGGAAATVMQELSSEALGADRKQQPLRVLQCSRRDYDAKAPTRTGRGLSASVSDRIPQVLGEASTVADSPLGHRPSIWKTVMGWHRAISDVTHPVRVLQFSSDPDRAVLQDTASVVSPAPVSSGAKATRTVTGAETARPSVVSILLRDLRQPTGVLAPFSWISSGDVKHGIIDSGDGLNVAATGRLPLSGGSFHSASQATHMGVAGRWHLLLSAWGEARQVATSYLTPPCRLICAYMKHRTMPAPHRLVTHDDVVGGGGAPVFGRLVDLYQDTLWPWTSGSGHSPAMGNRAMEPGIPYSVPF